MNLSLIILLLFNFFLVLFPLPGLDEIIAALVVCNFLFVFCFTLNQEGKSVCSAYVYSWTGWLITYSNAVYLIIGLLLIHLSLTCNQLAVIEECNPLQNVNAETVQNLKFTWLTVPEVNKDPFADSAWTRVPAVIKDPLACSFFRNLLLFFPGIVLHCFFNNQPLGNDVTLWLSSYIISIFFFRIQSYLCFK